MGVTGLWKLIEPCGQPIPVEMLENKILAVDISIWLHQAVKGFQDNRGSALANAHLLGLFHRLCKLMYYRIKPVFVFDGKVPTLKKETIAKRNLRRNKLLNEADRVQTLLLQSLAKEKVVQQALGSKAAAELLKSSPSKNRAVQKRPDIDDIFKLPDLPPIKETNDESDLNTSAETSFTSDTDSSLDESKPRHHYNQNLQAIDVKSKYFRNLPADIRHEILIDIKETRKQSSWGKLHELPSKSNEFSSYQMKRLLKRRQVQESLEEAEKEMDGVRTFTLSELENIFSEEGIIEPSTLPNTKHISSDANTRFLLVRDLKKTLATTVAESEVEVKPETSASALAKDDALKKETPSDLGDEYDDDLQKAIQMSLDQSAVYSESDYEYKGNLKLSKEQRKHLKNTAVGLARAYMIEHAGMNDEDVQGLLDHTQALSEDDEFNFTFGVRDGKENTERERKAEAASENTSAPPESVLLTSVDLKDQGFSKTGSIELNSVTAPIVQKEDFDKNVTKPKEAEDVEEVGIISDSNSDSELEEVCDSSSVAKKPLEIFVDTSKPVAVEDDIFADIFPITKESKINIKPSSSNVTEILQVLKKQASEISKINLSDIKLDPSIIEILDDESVRLGQNLICESDDDVLSPFKSSVTQTPSVAQSSSAKEECTQLKDSLIDKEILDDEGNVKKNSSEEQSSSVNLSNDTEPKVSLIDKEILEDQNSITKNSVQQSASDNLSDEESTPPDSLVVKELKNDSVEATKSNLKDDSFKSETKPETNEIIEIIDDSIPTKISPTQTPSKKKSISEFFETKYFIKRTPEKAAESDEVVPKVKSPFFIKKTRSGSAKKRNATDDEESPVKKSIKASKMLFEKSNDNDSEIIQIKDETEEHNQLEITANVLRENKTHEELQCLASSLAKEKVDLEMERNRQDRMGMTITERMSSECMQLLRLFGVPFIAAPMEAEAQCAFLDSMQLTNGTITDDSDIWLFGGQTVYKNFFAQNKHVMEFKSDKIENSFNVDRSKLIQLALLVGSDYTTGINGIGAVTALEILATFSTNESKDAITNQQTATVLTTLRNFRDWWASTKSSIVIGNSTRHRLRTKLKNIELSEGFPSSAVVEAYLTPTIDNSQESFSWGSPDVESIIEFTRKNFGWTRLKTDEILGPVLKKINEKKTQATIKNYFAVKSAISTKQIPVSKRVQNAINKMSADYKPDEEKDETKTAAKPKRGKRKQPAASTSTSDAVPKKTTRVSRNKVNLPTSVQVIPQRQKDIEEMQRKKELAAAVLKKSNAKK